MSRKLVLMVEVSQVFIMLFWLIVFFSALIGLPSALEFMRVSDGFEVWVALSFAVTFATLRLRV